jgi:hypothetical protein
MYISTPVVIFKLSDLVFESLGPNCADFISFSLCGIYTIIAWSPLITFLACTSIFSSINGDNSVYIMWLLKLKNEYIQVIA